MCGILDEPETLGVGSSSETTTIDRPPAKVHGDDCSRATGEGRATFAGLMLSVSASISTSTGVAPQCSIALIVATKVNGVLITSSPGPTSHATSARCSAAVQDETATASGAPR